MAIPRRQVLTGGTAAGVSLSVAGVLPSLAAPAAAAPGHDARRPGGGSSGGRPFPPLQDDPNGILGLPTGFSYQIVTREDATDLSFGQGKTPAFHDGTGVVAASSRRLTIIQNHENDAVHVAVRRPAHRRNGLGPGRREREWLHGDHDGRGRQADRRVGRYLRHRPQLRRRRGAVGHLAHL
jgi:hypothetical protein